MLSRVAESLYWLSRYLERAEHTARLIDVHLNSMLDQAGGDENLRWQRLLLSLRTPAPDGEIELSSVGWSKREVDDVNAMLASRREQKPLVLWRAGEDIPEFRAG